MARRRESKNTISATSSATLCSFEQKDKSSFIDFFFFCIEKINKLCSSKRIGFLFLYFRSMRIMDTFEWMSKRGDGGINDPGH